MNKPLKITAPLNKSLPNADKVIPILGRLVDIQKELDLRKKLYEEYDECVTQLARLGFESTEFEGLILTLVDNFAEKNTGWTRSAVKRWELKIKEKKDGT